MADNSNTLAHRTLVQEAVVNLIKGRGGEASGEGYYDPDQVYGYEKGDLDGVFPVIRIMSSSRHRPQGTFQGTGSMFSFAVQVLVLFENLDAVDAENNWTNKEAEDLINDIEFELSSLLQRAGLVGCKLSLGKSFIRKDVINGEVYITENFPLEVTVHQTDLYTRG